MNIFDIMGPIMVGPSSSHTAGAARIGLITRHLLGSRPAAAELLLHGSFAATGKGHGTDRALVAGLLGMQPDDPDVYKRQHFLRSRGTSFPSLHSISKRSVSMVSSRSTASVSSVPVF